MKVSPSRRVKVTVAPKAADPFYLSAEWRAFVEAEKIRRFGSARNARCQDHQCRMPERRGIRVFADHIVELRDDGAKLDPMNVLFRCGSCHTRVTAERRARRLQGPPHT
jgi:hypothetical protein